MSVPPAAVVPQVSVLSSLACQLHHKLLQQREASVQLEVQMLQQEAQHLQALVQHQAGCADHALAAEARGALSQVLAGLRQLVHGGGDDAAAANDEQQLQPAAEGWLRQAVASMQQLAAQATAQAQLVAARREAGVQSDEAVQTDWQRCIAQLPSGPMQHALSHKAVAEAITRIHMRALRQLEGGGPEQVQQQQGLGWSQAGAASLPAPAQQLGCGAASSTIFDAMSAHYSSQHSNDGDVQLYDATLWQEQVRAACQHAFHVCKPHGLLTSWSIMLCCAGAHLAPAVQLPAAGKQQQQGCPILLLCGHARSRARLGPAALAAVPAAAACHEAPGRRPLEGAAA